MIMANKPYLNRLLFCDFKVDGYKKNTVYEQKYIFYQKFEEFRPEINEIVELKNGNLVFSNKIGIKIYYKNSDKYNLQLKIESINVVSLIEIKPNILILFKYKEEQYRSGCLIDVM